MRVLVTGSRDWDDWEEVFRRLLAICNENDLNLRPDQYGNTLPDPSRITVVHGACPTGADHWAEQWCVSNWLSAERHPADWAKHGKRAGFVRNSEMVNLGADVCLAFLNPCTKTGCGHHKGAPAEQHDSHGASMTTALCEFKGIPVVEVRPSDTRRSNQWKP